MMVDSDASFDMDANILYIRYALLFRLPEKSLKSFAIGVSSEGCE